MESNILEWVSSFDSINPSYFSTFETLANGYAISYIINQIKPDTISMDSLAVPKHEDDWITRLKNIRNIMKALDPIFKEYSIIISVDASGIAKKSNLGSLKDIMNGIITLSFMPSKKEETLLQVSKLSVDTKSYIKKILESGPFSSAFQELNVVEAQIKPVVEVQIKAVVAENAPNSLLAELEEENKRLDAKYQSLIEEAKKIPTNEVVEYKEQKALLEKLAKENASLEIEISQNRGIDEKKESVNLEIAQLKQALELIDKQIQESIPTIESLKQSTNPTIRALFKEIEDAEKLISAEYHREMLIKTEKLKKEFKRLKAITKQLESKFTPEDIEADKLSAVTQLEETINRSNQINNEIYTKIQRTEAIEKIKRPRSYLEIIRTSDTFMPPK